MGNLFNKNAVKKISSGDSNFSDTLNSRRENFTSGYKIVACSTPNLDKLALTFTVKRDNWIIDVDELDDL